MKKLIIFVFFSAALASGNAFPASPLGHMLSAYHNVGPCESYLDRGDYGTAFPFCESFIKAVSKMGPVGGLVAVGAGMDLANGTCDPRFWSKESCPAVQQMHRTFVKTTTALDKGLFPGASPP